MGQGKITVVIPSYEPDEKLINLLKRLNENEIWDIVIVDDGSIGEEYQKIFTWAENTCHCKVLHHDENMGKGRALKTAFGFCLKQDEKMIGCVTIDSDGQHSVNDMIKCMEALRNNPESLILGVRDFDQTGIPKRSVFGNKCTSKVMRLLTGVSVSDTQTGLRAIPVCFMERLLDIKGDRFEFETNMLLETKQAGISIVEVPIETIYIEENRTSHFHPLKDSLRIYTVFLKFVFSSLSSSFIDAALFMLFEGIFLAGSDNELRVLEATVAARVISASYNFCINYKVVFKSNGSKGKSLFRYAVLAICIMLTSGILVEFLHRMIPIAPILIKVPVDFILFFVSFFMQRDFVYRRE